PLRDELPDIDLDVESARREEVYEMVLARYGEDRAACVTMVDTYRARAAIREVGKALGYPDDEIDRAAKAFPHMGAQRIREAIERLPELRGSNLGAGQLELLFRVAERLNGFPRHLALHPSGIVLSGPDLPDRLPMERSFQGYRMLQADKDDVEVFGLLKLDVLGVRMLSTLRHALDEIERTIGVSVDLDRIPTRDPRAFELIRRSDTIGCFQIESPGQRELLQKFQPERWEDLVIDISLFRPGPVKSDMITPFIRRRQRWEATRYAHPSLRPALAETEGVIVYHEQVMRVVDALLGCGLVEADRIRRHLDAEQASDEVRHEVISRAVKRGFAKEEAERIWDATLQFASFGFCKAHAAAFAVPTYQSAWLKAHHPAHFLAGVLTHEPGMYPRRLIVQDAREHGIAILPLDVNRSAKAYTVEPTVGEGAAPERRVGEPVRHPVRDGSGGSPPEPLLRATPSPPQPYGIRLGLQDVHGITDAEVEEVLTKRPFASVQDFLRRANVSRPVTEALAHAGAFDRIRQDGPAWTRRDRVYAAMTTEPDREGAQLELPLHGEPAPPGLRDYTEAEVVRAELEVQGIDASRHLLTFYEPLLEDLGVTRSVDLSRRRGGQHVMVAGVKVSSQTPAVRSGQRIIFLTLDDATGPIEVTVFERVQEKVAATVFHSFLLVVWGRLRRTGVRGVSVIADEVWDLVALGRARRAGRLREAMEGSARTSNVDAPWKLWHSSGGSAGR
ncbi:MAG TPA: OB-fold nucleic acid binding domain-containing protein, partial [Actinomycetota bacterium]|nr:OB-fold nucleic acid binding domain-containing protein [Actinomycetota bacterium]